MGDRQPVALGREGEAAGGGGRVERLLPALVVPRGRRACPALQATAPPGWRARASTQAPPVSAKVRVEPSGPVTAIRPSSPPVTRRSPSPAATRMPASGWAATGWVSPSRGEQDGAVGEGEGGGVPEPGAGDDVGRGGDGTVCWVREGASARDIALQV